MSEMIVNNTFNQKCKEKGIDLLLQDKLLVPRVDRDMIDKDYRKLIYIDFRTNKVGIFTDGEIDEDDDLDSHSYNIKDVIDYCKFKTPEEEMSEDFDYFNYYDIREGLVKQSMFIFDYKYHDTMRNSEVRFKYIVDFIKHLLSQTEDLKREKKLELVQELKG